MQTIKDYSWIIRHINNAGHFFFYNAIVRFMEGREANIRTLLPIWSIFKQWFERENEIYKRSSKAIETKAVETALKERRTAYVALRRGIRSALYSDDESVRKSGARLMEVSDNFKNIYHAPMTEASSLVHGMLKDLKEERYLPHIIALGLEQYVARLKRANEDFDAVHAQRMRNRWEAVNKGNMRQVRPMVDESFRKFADAVNVLHASSVLRGGDDASGLYSEIVEYICSLVRQYHRIYSRRSHSGEKGTAGDALPKEAVGKNTSGTKG